MYKHPRHLAILACGILCHATFYSARAFAADSVTADPVIITATRINENVSLQTTNVTIITQDQISNSTATSLTDLLHQEAGIQTRQLYGNHSSRATVDLRGFGASASLNTLFLVDGRRLNDIDLAAVDLSIIPLHNIERIEIIRGGGSVLYGDGAVGGAINIITKKSARQGTRARLELTAGSYDSQGLIASVEGSEAALSYHVAADSQRSDGYRDNNTYRHDRLQTDVRYTGEQGQLFFQLGGDKQELELPGARTVDPGIALDELATDRKGTATPNDYAERNGYNLVFGLTRLIGNDTEVIIDVGYRDKQEQAFFDDYSFNGLFASYLDTELGTWSFTPRIRINNNLLSVKGRSTLGLDYYFSDYESDRAQNPGTINQPIHQISMDQHSVAVYAEHSFLPQGRFNYTVGARLQQVRTDATDRFDAGAPGASAFDSEAAVGDNEDTQHALKAGLNFRLDEQTTLYANLNRSFRLGTVDETFATFPGRFTFLQPQTSIGLDAGFRLDTGRLQLSNGFYVMKLKNEIHFDPATFSNVNLDPTRRYGIEFSSRYQVNETFAYKLDWAFTRATFTQGDYRGNNVPLVAEVTASLAAMWELARDTDLTTTVNYVGDKHFDNDQSNSFSMIPAYTTVDVKLRHQANHWMLSAHINNLFDEKYFEYGVRSSFTPGRYNAYPLPERNFLVSVSRTFD